MDLAGNCGMRRDRPRIGKCAVTEQEVEYTFQMFWIVEKKVLT